MDTMNVLKDTSKCTGCSACLHACPQNCIIMCDDECGFFYPKIKVDECVECDACRIVCPESDKNNFFPEKNVISAVYAFKNTDHKIRMSSSSGGFFSLLSDYTIKNSGVVFGAKFNRDFRVVHSKASSKIECEAFRGSKYVQSEIGNSFSEIKHILSNGEFVLFSGTPCQVAGLKSFLNKPYENLLTCDFICHGVPSPGLWRDYISYLHKINGSHLSTFSFRDKSRGWDDPTIKMTFKNSKTKYVPIDFDFFGHLFRNNIILREKCHSCSHANLNRPSDLTIGDFWKIDEIEKSFNDNKGISQILINTPKGQQVFDEVKKGMAFIEVELEKSCQPNLIKPTPHNKKSICFWEEYKESGFDKVYRNFKPRYILTKKILKTIKLYKQIQMIVSKLKHE